MSDPSSSRPPRSYRPSRPTMIRVLTSTQNASALVFSSFLVVHLASPLAAALGGSTLADKTMLIARDVYLPLEPILIYFPLSIHLTSSLLKRLLLLPHTRTLSSHIYAGYALLPLVLPHILTHRLIPSSSTPPINSLSPSELNYDFVSWGIYRYPLWSTLSYLGLVGIGVWHAGIGSMKIVSWLRPKRTDMGFGTVKGMEGEQDRRVVPRSRKWGAKGLLVGVLGVVGMALGRLYSEGGAVGGVMVKRYEAVYQVLPWAGLLR